MAGTTLENAQLKINFSFVLMCCALPVHFRYLTMIKLLLNITFPILPVRLTSCWLLLRASLHIDRCHPCFSLLKFGI